MTQEAALKLLCFCFFSAVTAEMYTPSYAFLRNALALRGEKNVPIWAQIYGNNCLLIVARFICFI